MREHHERRRAKICGVALSVAALFLTIINPGATANAKAVVIYKFSGSDGSWPQGPLIEDQAGNLYGTTFSGGSNNVGVVFELSPAENGTWTETVLHSFGGFSSPDGSRPNGGLVMDGSGNIYGTTYFGGHNCCGVVFELSPGGAYPNGSLALDQSGNLYGTAQLGGNYYSGVVFELSPSGHGTWSETALWSFAGIPDGSIPDAGVILDTSGNLYGTTNEGGRNACHGGCGIVFSLVPSNSGWIETLLYEFKASEQNMPAAPLVRGRRGSLYGTAGYDVFRLKPPNIVGGNWKKATIYEFTEGIAGTIPSGRLSFDGHNNLYATTASSGIEGFGTASELSPPLMNGGAWTQTTLAKFACCSNNQPWGGILVGSDDNLYGAVFDEPGYIFAIAH